MSKYTKEFKIRLVLEYLSGETGGYGSVAEFALIFFIIFSFHFIKSNLLIILKNISNNFS